MPRDKEHCDTPASMASCGFQKAVKKCKEPARTCMMAATIYGVLCVRAASSFLDAMRLPLGILANESCAASKQVTVITVDLASISIIPQ